MYLPILGWLFLLLQESTCQSIHSQPALNTIQAPLPERKYVKVPVTLGVMSRCPDALFCENVFDNVLSRVGMNRIDADLAFIARLNVSEPKYGVTCLHGAQECAGNIQELCVLRHADGGKLSTWWNWLQCVNMGGPERIGTLELAIDCAVMSGIDWVQDGIYECVAESLSGPGRRRGMDDPTEIEGLTLFKASMERARLANITKSCTIQISGKTRCIRDGGRWYDCEGGSTPAELAASITKEWQRLNPDV